MMSACVLHFKFERKKKETLSIFTKLGLNIIQLVYTSRRYFFFPGAFADLRKLTVRSLMSVCPSVCQRGTAMFPQDGFFSKFDI